MNKPRLKPQEVLLMVLPVGVLAVIGIWMRGKSGPTLQMSGPFKFIVEETKFEPVTALEASSGYNTKLVVVLNHEGSTPAWWGGGSLGTTGCGIGSDPHKPEQFESRKKPGCWISGGALTYKEEQVIKSYHRPDRTSPMSIHAPHWDEKRQRYKMKFNMALNEVPEKVGEVTLKGALAAGLSATTAFSIVVRKAGEKIPEAKVSRYSPAALDKVEINNSGSETMVTLVLRDKEQSPPRNTEWWRGMVTK